jgi:hypothetical protein
VRRQGLFNGVMSVIAAGSGAPNEVGPAECLGNQMGGAGTLSARWRSELPGRCLLRVGHAEHCAKLAPKCGADGNGGC